jgi:hypothetical protein
MPLAVLAAPENGHHVTTPSVFSSARQVDEPFTGRATLHVRHGVQHLHGLARRLDVERHRVAGPGGIGLAGGLAYERALPYVGQRGAVRELEHSGQRRARDRDLASRSLGRQADDTGRDDGHRDETTEPLAHGALRKAN